jgi:PilZ domain-containing protein
MYIQRKYPRFPVSASAIVKTSSDRVKFPGSIEMFSRSGAGIYTNVMVEKGTSIQLEIDIYTGAQSSKCHLSGRVKNFTEWGEKGLLGVQFDQEIGPQNEPALYDYLECLERELITEYKKSS